MAGKKPTISVKRIHPREYTSWMSMRRRCNNPNTVQFKHYGGRGIKVCQRWDDFWLFLSDMGPRPAGTSIDRIDGSKDYQPDNCRWATRSEQMRNTSQTRFITFEGETRCVSEWAARIGITGKNLKYRIDTLKWPLKKAITTPQLRLRQPMSATLSRYNPPPASQPPPAPDLRP